MSQNSKILDYLERHKCGISQRDAINQFHCYRLSARIADLRMQGHPIVTEWETSINEDGDRSRYAVYRLLPQKRSK